MNVGTNMDYAVSGLEQRMQDMIEELRNQKLKITHQRVEIIREIVNTKDHPDVETIFRRVKSRVPTVSLDTIYRTVSALQERGMINRIQVDSGPVRYDGDITRHHHFVCAQCGRISDIASSDREAYRSTDRFEGIGSVDKVEVLFRGTCNSCLRTAGA